jgi:hypothetical protein
MGKEILSDTIAGVCMQAQPVLRSLLLTHEATACLDVESFNDNYLKIRAASCQGRRSSASILINKMYAARGYLSSGLSGNGKDNYRMTLTAHEGELTTGTVTIGFDGPHGLMSDDLFKMEVDALRSKGRRVCEFTKLAMQSSSKSKRALASLFHVAYIYAHCIHNYEDLFIEVNPRHVGYYQRTLGFTVMGPQRFNRRVNAPAVLLRLNFAHAAAQIGKFGDPARVSSQDRSLYAYCFSVKEEAAIVGRLRGLVSDKVEPSFHTTLPAP